MFHQNVSRYGLATHLALAAALPAALAQFVSEHYLAISILWTSLGAWVWLIFEPSVLAGETVSRARMRVLKGIVMDPFAWFLFFATAFAMVRWLNSGVALFYDAEKTIWSVKDPLMSIVPASSGDAAFLPFAVITVMTTVILGVRHALGKNARIWFGVSTGAFSAIGGIAAVICAAIGEEQFKSAATVGFGEPFFAGSAFAFILPVAIACGIEAEERRITKARLLFAFSVAGNAAAAFVFLPLLLSGPYLVLSVATAVVSLVLCKRREGAAPCARAASMLAFGIVGAVATVMVPSYKTVIQEKIAGLDAEKSFPPVLVDRNEALQRVSVAMWRDHQWGGVGVGAFKLQAAFYADKDDWSVLPPRPTQSSNGYFTILAERGIIGSLFCVAGLGFLVFFWVYRLIGSIKWHREQDEGRSWVFCIPSVVWAGLIVLFAALVDAWFSSGFPLTALAVPCTAAMALAAASFPKLKTKRAKESKD